MKLQDVGAVLKQSFTEWNGDHVPRLGAALAYYSVFSLAPLVLLAIGIAGLFLEEKMAREGIIQEIETTVGEPGAKAIEEMIRNTQNNGQSQTATAVGMILLIFGASGVFVQLQDAFNAIWRVAPRPERGVLGMIRDRFLSFGIVLGTGFLLLVSLVISAVLAAVSAWLTPSSLPGGAVLWQAINAVVSFAFITLMFAMIFKLMPDVELAWSDVWPGALVTTLLFTLGKFAIGLYLGQSSTTSAFGAAGSLVVILIWVYYSSQILLFGAEFIRVWTHHLGSRVEPSANALPVQVVEHRSPLHAYETTATPS